MTARELDKLSLSELQRRKGELEASLSVFFGQIGAALPELEAEYAALRDELERRESASSPPRTSK